MKVVSLGSKEVNITLTYDDIKSIAIWWEKSATNDGSSLASKILGAKKDMEDIAYIEKRVTKAYNKLK